MGLKTGIMVMQMLIGFGMLAIGLYAGGMKDLWWLAIIGGVMYFCGLLLPYGYKLD